MFDNGNFRRKRKRKSDTTASSDDKSSSSSSPSSDWSGPASKKAIAEPSAPPSGAMSQAAATPTADPKGAESLPLGLDSAFPQPSYFGSAPLGAGFHRSSEVPEVAALPDSHGSALSPGAVVPQWEELQPTFSSSLYSTTPCASALPFYAPLAMATASPPSLYPSYPSSSPPFSSFHYPESLQGDSSCVSSLTTTSIASSPPPHHHHHHPSFTMHHPSSPSYPALPYSQDHSPVYANLQNSMPSVSPPSSSSSSCASSVGPQLYSEQHTFPGAPSDFGLLMRSLDSYHPEPLAVHL